MKRINGKDYIYNGTIECQLCGKMNKIKLNFTKLQKLYPNLMPMYLFFCKKHSIGKLAEFQQKLISKLDEIKKEEVV